MTRYHACGIKIGPNRRKVFLLHTQKIDALTAGNLDRRDVEFIGNIGNRAQFARVGQAAPHARHHGIGAVFLDVGMHAFIDET